MGGKKNIMIKKILSTFVAGVLCILAAMPSVFAAAGVTAQSYRDTGEITLTGNIGTARSEYVYAVIIDDDYNASHITPATFSERVFAMAQGMSEDDGDYELVLRLNDSHLVTDYYRAVVYFTDGTNVNDVFTYESYYEIPYALRDLGSYAEADADDFYALYDGKDDVFAAESENVQVYYGGFDGTEKLAWATTMIKIRPEAGYIEADWRDDSAKVDAALESFNETFKKAEYLTELMYNKATKEDVKAFLDAEATKTTLGIDARYYQNKLPANQAAEDVRLAVSEAVVNADPKPTTPAELNALIEETLAVEEFKRAANMDDCKDLLSAYSAVFTIDSESTTKLASLEKADVCETMYANKDAGTANFDSKANIISAYEAAIASEYTEKYGDGGSGDGGSGDGGSGDGGSITIGGGGAVTPDVDENKEKLTFKDLGNYGWAKDAIYSLVDDGVLSGFGDETFRPGEKVTREQFVTMLVNRYQKATKADITKFADVKAGAWYYDYVAIGVGSGMVYGLSETEFGVGKPITRQDLAVMAYRAMGSQYVATGDIALRDIDSVAGYARTAVEALYEMGIVSGDENGNFRPADNATRAEAARILYLLK